MAITPNEYQKGCLTTAIYQDKIENLPWAKNNPLLEMHLRYNYCVTKLNGEAGEIAEHIGKSLRDDDGIITAERAEKLFAELGDVCWYVAMLSTELGFKLEEIMEHNLIKLASRKERGMLSGSGSSR